ncbi:MAG: amino acid deaminase, partial [Actinobacteria bacterium]|nr:amino acid deaminase [Actinomycetota bacterium]
MDVRAVAGLADTMLPPGTKGRPFGIDEISLGKVASSGASVLDGGFAMPLMVLKASALQRNAETMSRYCAAHGVSLAPHGKTTMSPQLFQRQFEAGAWALTAATPAHLQVYRRFGIERILYANELVEPSVIAWLAQELLSTFGDDLGKVS